MNSLNIPDQKSIRKLVTGIFELLFPSGDPEKEKTADEKLILIQEQMKVLVTGLGGEGEAIVPLFFRDLPGIRSLLLEDAGFILASDPAATSLTEVTAIYPGFFAIFCYRIAHYLALLPVTLLPRMITEYAHRITGIDIHPLARIGTPFSIDHGTGIVIGETAEIGTHVKIYQGVTLGALSVDKSTASRKRHPTIEDHVILYAGCTILGGETVVGRNSVIGGNVWLTESIRPWSVVYHKSEIIVRDHKDYEEPVNFII